jgi:hypothetical protein
MIYEIPVNTCYIQTYTQKSTDGELGIRNFKTTIKNNKQTCWTEWTAQKW